MLVEHALTEPPHKVTDPERIPAARYYDEAFFQLEKTRLWPHVWQMACRLEQIPEIGDWTAYTILDQSIIVVRTKAGVKAFHNACRHRGVQLAKGYGNCQAQGFICPFHGWRWNMDGENTFVYGRRQFSEAALRADDLRLPEVRVEVWGGCVFVNFDKAAPSFRETIGDVCDRLEAHAVDRLRADWWFATVLPANWKIAMEAFMEGYHTMRTHPQLYAAAAAAFTRYERDPSDKAGVTNTNAPARELIRSQLTFLERLSDGMAGLVHPKEVEIARQLVDLDLPQDPQLAMRTWYGILQDQITKQLRAGGAPAPDLNAVAVSDPVNAVEFLFPHYFLLPFFSSMSSYRVRPLTAETCLFELWSLSLFPEGGEPDAPREPTFLPYDSRRFPPIPQQDYANIPRQQAGLHAEGFRFMRLSKDVEGLISNYQRIIDAYLAGVSPDKLSKAVTMLGGAFDGPIRDLGF